MQAGAFVRTSRARQTSGQSLAAITSFASSTRPLAALTVTEATSSRTKTQCEMPPMRPMNVGSATAR